MTKCPDCDSTSDLLGMYGDGKCSTCHGTGSGDLLGQFVDGMFGTKAQGYPTCGGSGTCQTCGGSGEINN